jgi:hypothetical protein
MSHPIYRLTETAPPAVEPLSLAEIKTFLRIDHSTDDSLVTGLISAARQICESVTGRSLITRSYSLYLDHWPGTTALGWWDGVQEGADIILNGGVLNLPKPPLLSVTRINIYDAGNAATEFAAANYFVDTAGNPGRIVLKEGVLPPLPGRAANGIEIQFNAGYGAAAQNVPAMLRQGIKQIIAHFYEHRGDSQDQALIASGAAVLFHPYRMMSLS